MTRDTELRAALRAIALHAVMVLNDLDATAKLTTKRAAKVVTKPLEPLSKPMTKRAANAKPAIKTPTPLAKPMIKRASKKVAP